jgi:hypothetical protein
LLEIEGCLDQGHLEQAQLLLARAGENATYELGVSYLATRLLHLRGRLDAEGVCVRLRDLLSRSGPFPQAEALLRRLEAAPRDLGEPRPSPPAFAPVSVRTNAGESAIVGDAPTQAAMPRAPSDEAPVSRRPLLPLSPLEEIAIPDAPRLPTAGASTSPPDAAVPFRRSSPVPLRSPLPSPRLSGRPSLLPEDPESTASYRARAYGLAPAVSTSPPPRARQKSSLPRGAGRYNYVEGSAESEAGAGPFPRQEVLAAGRSSDRAANDRGRISYDPEGFVANPNTARDEFEREAWQVIGTLADPGDPEQLAQTAVRLLSSNSVTHWFAPFDTSLFGLYRFELALHALTAAQPAQFGRATLSLFGAYVGETLRHCQRGRWHRAQHNDDSEVLVGAFTWKPYHLVRDAAAEGLSPPFLSRLSAGLAPEGTAAWLAHRPSVVPRALWRDSPAPTEFPRLVAALEASPLGTVTGSPLDGSWDSLASLEPVADRICRSATPLRGTEPWLGRSCVLFGAYVGDVVRRRVGGSWHHRGGSREESYVLRLPSGFEAEPVAAIRERIKAQNGVRLVGYANALLRK